MGWMNIFLVGEAHEHEERDHDEKNQERIPACRCEDDVRDQPAEHEEFPMGDVEHLCYAENEGEPKGGQGVCAALEHSRENQLNKNL